MKKIALVIFGLSTIAVLIASAMPLGWLYWLSKPVIILALLFYYITSLSSIERSRAVILALLFSWIGDILLMNKDYFIAGLVAFLAAHIVYIIAYRQHRWEETETNIQGLQRLRLAFPIILGGTGLITILYPVLSDLKLPVIFYAIVLMVMVIVAIFRMARTSTSSFWMVFIGAVLFMISDSMIAVNKFLEPFAYAEFWIMLTYTAAQFMIIRGLILHWDAD